VASPKCVSSELALSWFVCKSGVVKCNVEWRKITWRKDRVNFGSKLSRTSPKRTINMPIAVNTFKTMFEGKDFWSRTLSEKKPESRTQYTISLHAYTMHVRLFVFSYTRSNKVIVDDKPEAPSLASLSASLPASFESPAEKRSGGTASYLFSVDLTDAYIQDQKEENSFTGKPEDFIRRFFIGLTAGSGSTLTLAAPEFEILPTGRLRLSVMFGKSKFDEISAEIELPCRASDVPPLLVELLLLQATGNYIYM
jgi:hypothetical protein